MNNERDKNQNTQPGNPNRDHQRQDQFDRDRQQQGGHKPGQFDQNRQQQGGMGQDKDPNRR